MGDSRDALGDMRAAMPEEPQARWVSVWIAGTVKRSIQSPAGYVLVISRVEALLHPFPPQAGSSQPWFRLLRLFLAPGL